MEETVQEEKEVKSGVSTPKMYKKVQGVTATFKISCS